MQGNGFKEVGKVEQISKMSENVHELEGLRKVLITKDSSDQKYEVLASDFAVKAWLEKNSWACLFLKNASSDHRVALCSVVAIGQGDSLFSHGEKSLESILPVLNQVEEFYRSIGGIVGYHVEVLKLILAKGNGKPMDRKFKMPSYLDIREETDQVKESILWGLEALQELVEIYPVGGAGERLSLFDEKTDQPLPVAKCEFAGKTLLQGLIRDLQAREYFYFKVFGGQVRVPVAMMTSDEKNNHAHILKICEKQHWFDRPRNLFLFFKQPGIPVITEEGEWVYDDEKSTIITRPGGHGVIWNLAKTQGIISECRNRGRTKALVRQINNPLAGTDYGLLAFTGYGWRHDKLFGFSSCPRLLNASEGMNVLLEKQTPKGVEYSLTNVEYTEFAKQGIEDKPATIGSPYSAFPANTNILFADLNTVEELGEKYPNPGMILNMKSEVKVRGKNGNLVQMKAGRLESTMQNIADHIFAIYPQPIPNAEYLHLPIFMTFNNRTKTISVTKNRYIPGEKILETPESCFFDLMQVAVELLKRACHFETPAMCSLEESIEKGPSVIFLYNQALGPLYSVIGQKIRGGKVAAGSELVLEITEINLEKLQLDGSLQIYAEDALGHLDEKGIRIYSTQNGKCVLQNVKVENKGIDRSVPHHWWKIDYPRSQTMEIHLKGNGEFHAENVTFRGAHRIVVEDGTRVIAKQRGPEDEIEFTTVKIEEPTWHWRYRVSRGKEIVLTKDQGPGM